MTQAIPFGYPVVMTEDVVYATPGRACLITVMGSTTMQLSNDGTNWQNVTLDSNKGFYTAAGFVQTTGSTATVTAKPLFL